MRSERAKSAAYENEKALFGFLFLCPPTFRFYSHRKLSARHRMGYVGGNTAQGQNALLNLASGTYNTAIGCFSINSNKIGSFNTAVGAGTLFANTADNTATGAGALLNNTPGANNTVSGVFALFNNTTGASNTATCLGAKCPDLADLHPSPRSGLSYQTLVVTIEQKRIKK
jgi:hypothetical protein